MNLKVWVFLVRAPFLLLPLLLSIVGTLLAMNDGYFNWYPFLSFTAILVLLHITVNTLNEYHDHLSGIDFRTDRTMFSGGSGTLQQGSVKPESARKFAYVCFATAVLLSAHLILTVTELVIPIIILGCVFALFYTQIFAKWMLGEMAAGLGLGLLPVLGAYLVQAETLNPSVWLIGFASAMLTFNLQLLNEFPDQEADRYGGRKNIVMVLGEKKAAKFYVVINAGVYLTIITSVVLSYVPITALLALLTLPIAYKASSIALQRMYPDKKFVEGQKANIQMVLMTQALLGIGIFITAIQTLT
ncbi:MAG TPA: prenyltransferase [Candidatus Methanomethylophilaceae archaeon]|nr:prenyltransferase [Candidatus Methanomethylophilaceae archaeon]